MFLGAVVTAVAALLSTLKPRRRGSSSGGRRRKSRGRRIAKFLKKRRNNRSRPQRRRPKRRPSTTTTARPSAAVLPVPLSPSPSPAAPDVVNGEASSSDIERYVSTTLAVTLEPAFSDARGSSNTTDPDSTPLPLSPSSSVYVHASTSSSTEYDEEVDDAGNPSEATSSSKSVDMKCFETISGITGDSGYTDDSDSLIATTTSEGSKEEEQEEDCTGHQEEEQYVSENTTSSNDIDEETKALYSILDDKAITLESIERATTGTEASGTILVRNDYYIKSVGARHTTDDWTTYKDTFAQWLESVEGGKYDRFQFTVELPETGNYKMELTFFYDHLHWDNNFGNNHIVSSRML